MMVDPSECSHSSATNGFCKECGLQVRSQQICYEERSGRKVSKAAVKNVRCMGDYILEVLGNNNFSTLGSREEIKSVYGRALQIFQHLDQFYHLSIQKESFKKNQSSTRMYIIAVCIYHGLKQTIAPGIWPELVAHYMNLDVKTLISKIRYHHIFDRDLNRLYINVEYDVVQFVVVRLLHWEENSVDDFWNDIQPYLIRTNRHNSIHNIVFNAIYKAYCDQVIGPEFWGELLQILALKETDIKRITDKIRRKGGARNASLPYPNVPVIPVWVPGFSSDESSSGSSLSPPSPADLTTLQ